MRNLKRVLSTIMAVAMLMGMIVIGTTATSFSDDKDIVHKEAVDMATALNIINGYDDGTFRPAGNITRAEMCKMICFVMNGGNEPTLGTNPTAATFGDIRGHWAEKYIEYCVAEGIVAGMGDGTFQPEGNITGTQAAKMLLVALGYRAVEEGFNTSAWAVKINVRATEKKLFDGFSVDPNAALNRDNAARMIWNALQAGVVEYDTEIVVIDGQVQTQSTAKTVMVGATNDILTLLAKRFDQAELVGILTAYEWSSKDNMFRYTVTPRDDDGDLQVNNRMSFLSATDYSHLFGVNVKAVYKTKESKNILFGMVTKDASVMGTGIVGDIDVSNLTGTSITVGDEKYSLDKNLVTKDLRVIRLNEYNSNDITTVAMMLESDGDIIEPYGAFNLRVLDTEGNDGKADTLIIEPFVAAEVNSVSKGNNITLKTPSAAAFAGVDTSLDFDDNDIYDGVAKGDYVMVIPPANNAYDHAIVTPLESNSGDVTAKDGDDFELDSDVWYTAYHKVTSANGTALDKSASYEVFGVNGYVYFADEVTSATMDNVVLVGAVSDNEALRDEAVLYFTDGTSAVVTIKETKIYEGGKWKDIKDTAKTLKGDYQFSLFTYTEKSGQYTLKKLHDRNKVGTDAYAYGTDAGAALEGIDKDKDSKFSITAGGTGAKTYNVAEDAYLWVVYGKNTVTAAKDMDVKLLTGKDAINYKSDIDAKDSGAADIGNPILTEALLKDINGNRSMKAGMIFSYGSDKPTGVSGTSNYAYVLGVSEIEYDGDDGYKLKIWNGTEEQSGKIYADTDYSFEKGDVIEYSELSGNEIDVTGLWTKTANGETNEDGDEGYVAAIKGYGTRSIALAQAYEVDDNGDAVMLDGGLNLGNKDVYLVSSTKYLYVDTDKKAGQADAGKSGLTEADELQDEDGVILDDNFIPNVLVVVNDENEAVLVVVDTSNNYGNVTKKEFTP